MTEENAEGASKTSKAAEAIQVVLGRSGGLLDIQSFVQLSFVFKIPTSSATQDAILGSSALPTGPQRFRLWCKLLETDEDSPRFKEMSERERKDRRRRPRLSRESLETGPRADEFKKYLEMAHHFENSTKLTTGVYGEIWRDVGRTLPAHPFFKEDGGIGQTMLGRILSAVAVACPDTGYCQGMNYLVAALTLGRLPAEITGGLSSHTDFKEDKKDDNSEGGTAKMVVGRSKSAGILSDIIETFTADTNILYEEDRLDAEFDVYMYVRRLEIKGSKFSMGGMWEVGTPHMKLKVFQLENIMRWAVPRLHAHFEEIGFQPEILVSQWFMTHFSYTIPLNMLLRLWDYTLLLGWPGVYRVTIALLMAMEEQLLEFDLDDLGKAMRNFRTGTSNVLVKHLVLEDVLERAKGVMVTEGVLQQLQENFALEMISAAEVAMAAALHEAEEKEKVRKLEEEARNDKSTAEQSGDGGLLGTLSAMKRTVNGRVEDELKAMSASSSAPSGVSGKSLGALSGREASNWLLRYGDTLEGAKALEMLRIRDELKGLEVQIDMDKQNIQEKIVNACEVCRTAEEDLANASTMKDRMEMKMVKLRDMYATCMRNASTLAAVAASKIKQHEDMHGGTPVTLAEFHEKHASYSPVPVAKSRKDTSSSSSSFVDSIDSILGGLSPISPKARGTGGDATASTTSASTSSSSSMTSFEDSDSDLEDVDLSISVTTEQGEEKQDPDEVEGSVGSHDTLHSVPLSSESATPPRISVSLTAALEAEIRRSAATVESAPTPMTPTKASVPSGSSSGEQLQLKQPESELGNGAAAVSPEPEQKQRGLLSSIKRSTRSSLKGVAVSLGLGSSTPKAEAGGNPSERELHEQLTKIGAESQKCQQNIIIINRSFTTTQTNLQRAHEWYDSASLTVEEASQWKKSLCDQLQLLVEDTNRGRSQRLQHVANNYLF